MDKAAAKAPIAAMPQKYPGSVFKLCHSSMARQTCIAANKLNIALVVIRYAFTG